MEDPSYEIAPTTTNERRNAAAVITEWWVEWGDINTMQSE